MNKSEELAIPNVHFKILHIFFVVHYTRKLRRCGLNRRIHAEELVPITFPDAEKFAFSLQTMFFVLPFVEGFNVAIWLTWASMVKTSQKLENVDLTVAFRVSVDLIESNTFLALVIRVV